MKKVKLTKTQLEGFINSCVRSGFLVDTSCIELIDESNDDEEEDDMLVKLQTEDKQEALRWMKALDVCLVLLDIDNKLRQKIKYSDDEDELLYATKWRNELIGSLSAYNVDLEELVT